MSSLESNINVGMVTFITNCSACLESNHPITMIYQYVTFALAIVNILGNLFAIIILSDPVWNKAVLPAILKGISYFEILFNILTLINFFYQLNEPLRPFGQYGTTVVAAIEVILLIFDSLLIGSQMARNWSVTLLALFRYDMVCRSNATRRSTLQFTVFSNDNLVRVFVIMLLICVVIAIPRIFEVTPIICLQSAVICNYVSNYGSNKWFQYAYLGVIMFVFQSGGPIIITSCVSLMVIRKIQHRHRIRKRQGISSTNRFRKSQKNPGTLVLAVCITFMVLEFPSFFSKLAFFVFNIDNPYLAAVANLLIYVDSSLNLLIYMLSNKTFRKTSWDKIFCQHGRPSDDIECMSELNVR